jgi:hypothetical protein
MFFPLAEENDIYDIHGKQVDEINSVAEFLIHYAFNIIPLIPLDEDSDEQKFINTNISPNYTSVNFLDFCLLHINERLLEKVDLYNYHLPLTVEELFSPPPEIA